jgi:hypothetical protein
MLMEPVAVAVGLERWSAVRAWLSNTRVPLASLQLTAADGRAAQQVSLVVGQQCVDAIDAATAQCVHCIVVCNHFPGARLAAETQISPAGRVVSG